MPRALNVLQVMEDILKSHVARTHLSSNNLHSQMEGNMYKRKSDGKSKQSLSAALCNRGR